MNLPSFNKLNTISLTNEDIIILRGMHEHIIEFIRLNMINFINILSNDNIEKLKNIRINFLINKINESKFYNQIMKLYKSDNYRFYIINIILTAFEKAVKVFNNITKYSINDLNEIINNSNIKIKEITNFFKYNNKIKILHWFNLNDIESLL
jgi:hypothetical protein